MCHSPSAETGDWSNGNIIAIISKAEVPPPSDREMENCVDDSTCSNWSLTNSTISGPIKSEKQNVLLYVHILYHNAFILSP